MKRLVLLLVATLMIAGTLNAQTQWRIDEQCPYLYKSYSKDIYDTKTKEIYMRVYIPANIEEILKRNLKKIGLKENTYKVRTNTIIYITEEKYYYDYDGQWITLKYELSEDEQDVVLYIHLITNESFFSLEYICYYFDFFGSSIYNTFNIKELNEFIKTQQNK